ncbi:MAG: hypothetical protein WDW36_005473 [Sanguina aurantia]
MQPAPGGPAGAHCDAPATVTCEQQGAAALHPVAPATHRPGNDHRTLPGAGGRSGSDGTRGARPAGEAPALPGGQKLLRNGIVAELVSADCDGTAAVSLVLVSNT